MPLLTNMTINRTSASMNSSDGSGGYRYIGGSAIDVDNDTYQISARVDNHTVMVDDNNNLTVAQSLYTAGENIDISISPDGTRTISAEMFVSQFEPGDKEKYDANLVKVSEIDMSLRANSTRDAALTERVGVAESDIDALESRASDLEDRASSLEDRSSSAEERLDVLESDLNAETTGLKTVVSNHTQEIINQSTRIDQVSQDVAAHSSFIAEFSGLGGDLSGFGANITALQEDVSDLRAEDEALHSDITGAVSRITALEHSVNGLFDTEGDIVTDGHEQRISNLEQYKINNETSITFLSSRILDLEESVGIGEGAGTSGISEIWDSLQAAQNEIASNRSNIELLGGNISELSGAVNSLSDDILNKSNSINESIEELKSRVDSLESEADALSSTIASHSSAIETAVGRINGLNSTTSGLSQDIVDIMDDVHDIQVVSNQNSNDIADLRSSAIAGLDSQVQRIPAAEVYYNSLSPEAHYDDSVQYYYSLPATYSRFIPDPTVVQPETSYSESVSYYRRVYDNYEPYVFTTQEAWEQDTEAGDVVTFERQFVFVVVPEGQSYDPDTDYYISGDDGLVPYGYNEDTWDDDVAVGAIYVQMPSQALYDSDHNLISDDATIDPSVEYWTMDDIQYLKYSPLIVPVPAESEYDYTMEYVVREIDGSYASYEYNDDTWELDVSNGLFHVAGWARDVSRLATTAHDPSDETVDITLDRDAIIVIDSGYSNGISVAGSFVAEFEADKDRNRIVTIPVHSGGFITVSTHAGVHGTGVHGDIYVKYFKRL